MSNNLFPGETKIFIYQMKAKVGDIKTNIMAIKQHYDQALGAGANIMLLPELALCGYMARDLFLSEDFLDHLHKAALELVEYSRETALIITTAQMENHKLYNCALVAQNGRIIGQSAKKHLVNYGIFDEKRYFSSGDPCIIKINDVNIGLPICEDIWFSDVAASLKEQGAEILLVPNASPYHKDKFAMRAEIVSKRHQETSLPIIYCNQAIGHDGIIFDGRSFIYDGDLKIICSAFAQDCASVTMKYGKLSCDKLLENYQSQEQEIIDAIKLGLSDYLAHNGFSKVIIGLSGGIDSALVATLAQMTLGAENVFCYMLPSDFTSHESLMIAQEMASNLGVMLKIIPIQDILSQFTKDLAAELREDGIEGERIESGSITHQNLQARIRGTILMAKANQKNALLLTTGNKSEYATGYATLYGDMNGGFNPIKDLYKTEIYKIARYINSHGQEVIPRFIIEREPTAELATQQLDSDSLPPYELLDQILLAHIEQRQEFDELVKKFDPSMIRKVLRLVKMGEFKRHQSAPGVKISMMHFDQDRRFPITNGF
jgi:NAD+ synthetase